MFSFLIVLLLLIPAWAWGATYYLGNVSGTLRYKSGDWPSAGDTSAASLNAAVLALENGGHTLVVEAGTYTGQIFPVYGNITIRTVDTTDPDYASHIGFVVVGGAGVYPLKISSLSAGRTVSNITIKGLTFNGDSAWTNAVILIQGSTTLGRDTTNIVLDGLYVNVNNGGANAHGIWLTAATGIVDTVEIKNCTIMNNAWTPPNTINGSGIYSNGATNISVHNNIISDANHRFINGMYITDASNTWNIYENTISYCTNSSTAALGITILVSATNINVYRNIIDRCYWGIQTSSTVGGNRIYYNLITNSEVNGISAVYNSAGDWNYVNNNTVIHRPTGDGTGIALDQHAGKLQLFNNIVDCYTSVNTTGVAAIGLSQATSSWELNNNDYYITGNCRIAILDATGYTTLSDWKTAIAADARTGTNKDANSISADPVFVSASDFRLQPTSPAINAGVDVSLTTDYDGNTVPTGTAPDIGAYEFVKLYSRGAYAALPVTDAVLTTAYTYTQQSTVATDDNLYISQTNPGTYLIHQFQDNATNRSSATVTWKGKSDLAPSTSAVVLQVYNQNSTTWETLTSDTTTGADTEFTLTNTISDLTNYKNSNSIVSWRVYQQMQ